MIVKKDLSVALPIYRYEVVMHIRVIILYLRTSSLKVAPGLHVLAQFNVYH